MRKLTFLNASGTSTIFATSSDYKIISVVGLGTPQLRLQGQKAPFQDGETYIDTLFEKREIVVTGYINKPKNISAINTAKNTLLGNLSPKLGQGTLTYESSGGITRVITCIPRIEFADKLSNEQYQRFQITFT